MISIGWIVRIYAKDKTLVKSRVNKAVEMVKQIRSVTSGHIIIAVPKVVDCGQTVHALRREFLARGLIKDDSEISRNVEIIEMTGDPNTDALNFSANILIGKGCSNIAIVSGKVREHITRYTLERIEMAIHEGALITTVDVDPNYSGMLHDGFVLNTFTVWNAQALVEADMFSYEDEEEGGVEEMTPLINIIRKNGQCVSIITPEKKRELDVSDAGRYTELFDSKRARQERVMQKMGVTDVDIQCGVMR